MNLKDKIIVITGGTSGVGRQLVASLCQHNTVIVIARPSHRLTQLAKTHHNINVYSADLADPCHYQPLVASIKQEFPAIDILINNAATQHTTTFTEPNFNYDTISQEINVNFNAICSLSYLFIPVLAKAKEGAAILNVNSGLALVPKKTSAVYCASKAAMNIFSQSLSYQLEDTQIDVLQAFLPLVKTPMTQGRQSSKLTPEQAAEKVIDGLKRRVPINNIGKIKLLRALNAFVPGLAKNLLKRS
ncbi:SDR family oxidoreductase [Pseudoalteromonas luteoviolacea]|uniref:SDR family oxidoreductase n=1 Tax=Pseudoalteromonas luteoviolacea TaxID=43657 RepID=UPI0011528A66|nr:SDR family NAD(P)-dependent oxidoreductase [Pseudoalteromonas luteoviolacea]TQF70795.1 SDR family NAD(P)-dependent oxidoreductase [Pseudoalteromonas luteoviolacea]